MRKRKSRAMKGSPEDAEQLTAKFKAENFALAAVYWVFVDHGITEAELANDESLAAQVNAIWPGLSSAEVAIVSAANIPSLVSDEFNDFVDDSMQDDPAKVAKIMAKFKRNVAKFFSATTSRVQAGPAMEEDSDEEENEEEEASDISSASSDSESEGSKSADSEREGSESDGSESDDSESFE